MTSTTSLLISVLIILLTSVTDSRAKDLGTFGATYMISEPDSLAELREKAAKVDWKKVFDREKLTRKVRNFRPKELKRLPAARRDRAFLSDLSYTLDVDIPDGKGGVLYPKGYTFNPLDYLRFRRTIVVIDGNNRRQVEWFRKSNWFKDVNAMLLLTDGGYFELGKRLRRPVFYANSLIVDRLGLKAVPSVVRQNGRFMEVREYAVN